MKQRIAFTNKRRRGFTLIEVLLATSVGAMVTGALVVSLYQVSEVTRGFQDTMNASGQLQSVTSVLNRDAMAAYYSEIVAPNELVLEIPEYAFGEDSDAVTHEVTYEFKADGTLARTEDGSGETVVGRNLVSVVFSATQGIDSTGIITAMITAEDHGYQDQATLVFRQRAGE